MRNPRRTAGSASALMVGTAVVALFTTFGASVKASIDDMVDDSFGGDLDRRPGRLQRRRHRPGLAPAIAELPEVRRLGRHVARRRPHRRRTTVEPMATDPAALAAVLDLEVVGGSLADVGPGEIAVSTSTPRTTAVQLGDVLPMSFVDGATTDLTVAASTSARTSSAT